MELIRSLAVLSEAPSSATEAISSALGLETLPSEAAFTELFSLQLFPYASVYLGAEGMVGGDARDRIAGFWRALDRSPPTEPDHLTVLLASLAELTEREAEAADANQAARWRQTRSAFFWEHLATWVPMFLDRVAEIGSSFYQRWAELLLEVMVEQAKDLGPPPAEPLCFRQAPGLDQFDQETGDDFLQVVLAPVRTGTILARYDLVRCARALDLGLRIGERKFALRSLLGQAPKQTLEWLGREAAGRADRHAALPRELRPVSAFWQAKAAEFSGSLEALAEGLED